MEARNFALISGVVFVAIGILGFIPVIVNPHVMQPDPDLVVSAGYGYLMGLFPVNILHNLVHLAIGLWGLSALRSFKDALFYCQGLAIFYSLLAVMGLIPALGTTLGLIPIFGNDVLLHLGTAAIAAYYGFVAVSGVDNAIQEERQIRSRG